MGARISGVRPPDYRVVTCTSFSYSNASGPQIGLQQKFLIIRKLCYIRPITETKYYLQKRFKTIKTAKKKKKKKKKKMNK